MQIRCPSCDVDELEGYSMCSRCGLRFDHTFRVVTVPPADEIEVACELCDRERFWGNPECRNCGRMLREESGSPGLRRP